jgi:hypothetical protein
MKRRRGSSSSGAKGGTEPPKAGGPTSTPILSHPRYHLIRRKRALKVAGVGGVWYDICFQRKVKRVDRAGFSDPLKLHGKANKAFKGRTDLEVELKAGGRRKHSFYHRVVGLALLRCHWKASGKLLERPFKVPLRSWDPDAKGRCKYEVHHLKGWRDVDPRSLAVLPRRLHAKVTQGKVKLQAPRSGWGT